VFNDEKKHGKNWLIHYNSARVFTDAFQFKTNAGNSKHISYMTYQKQISKKTGMYDKKMFFPQ